MYNDEVEADTFTHIFDYRLKKLIKREPEDAKYYFTLGMLHMDMQDYKEAEKDFKNCIKVSDLKTGSGLVTSKLGQSWGPQNWVKVSDIKNWIKLCDLKTVLRSVTSMTLSTEGHLTQWLIQVKIFHNKFSWIKVSDLKK